MPQSRTPAPDGIDGVPDELKRRETASYCRRAAAAECALFSFIIIIIIIIIRKIPDIKSSFFGICFLFDFESKLDGQEGMKKERKKQVSI